MDNVSTQNIDDNNLDTSDSSVGASNDQAPTVKDTAWAVPVAISVLGLVVVAIIVVAIVIVVRRNGTVDRSMMQYTSAQPAAYVNPIYSSSNSDSNEGSGARDASGSEA